MPGSKNKILLIKEDEKTKTRSPEGVVLLVVPKSEKKSPIASKSQEGQANRVKSGTKSLTFSISQENQLSKSDGRKTGDRSPKSSKSQVGQANSKSVIRAKSGTKSQENSDDGKPGDKRRFSDKSRGSGSNHSFQDEEFTKTTLLQQIEVLKGELERRFSRALTDNASDDMSRRDSSRRGSNSSIGSQTSKGSHNSEDNHLDKTKRAENIRMESDKRKRVDTFCTKVTGFFANMDSLASRVRIPRHDICIFFALYLIPVLVVIFIWDIMAVLVFEIPQLSMIEHPGFMLGFHFVCVPAAMYGYMMRVLMGLDKTRMTTLGMICVVVHPILLCLRAFIEIYFEGFQSQLLQRYENTSG